MDILHRKAGAGDAVGIWKDGGPDQGFWQVYVKHISDIMAISPEAGDDAGIATLIGKKFHVFTIYPKAICSSAR